ncbi:MAG: PLP-dependent cysteine synthase family protein [Spirochaetes bacterium]|nr:PLP-dependent cysteine synthase family protein [Spirochaetota bacterium]
MDKAIKNKFDELEKLIGSTPLAEITYRHKKSEPRTLYFKLEYFNLSGSIKDRMALNILKCAYENGSLSQDHVITEVTSGNTGISFCAIGAYLGHKVLIYMPDWMSEERKGMMRSFGAELRLLSKAQGGFKGCLEAVEELKKTDRQIFTPYQFENENNSLCHYENTGPEISLQLKKAFNKGAEAVIAGVGTGGTIMGLGRYLKAVNPKAKAYPLEPASSPTLSTGHKVGSHRIQGISDEFIPPILKLAELDEIIDVDDGDSIIMAQKITRTLGIGLGISSGANFLGAVKVQNMLGADKTVVSVFADDNKKYLSTDLLKEEPVKDGFLSPDIELLEYRAVTI